MSDNDIIGDAERQQQQMLSETENDTEKLRAVPIEPQNNSVHSIDEESDEDSEELPVTRSFSDILHDSVGASNVVRLVISPELNFVVNLFNDDIQNVMLKKTSVTYNDDKLNLVQPLSKRNDKSGRIGILREPMAEFATAIQDIVAQPERIVVTPDTGALLVDGIVGEFVQAANRTLFVNFPLIDGVHAIEIEEDVDGELMTYAIAATDYIRLRSFVDVSRSTLANGEVEVLATVKFVVHIRVPSLLKQDSVTFDRNFKQHVNYLERIGAKANIPSTVYAAFYTQDLVEGPVAEAFDWIRNNTAEVSVLSFRNAETGGEFFGIGEFDTEDYLDNLFNGGDFTVAFNLEKGV